MELIYVVAPSFIFLINSNYPPNINLTNIKTTTPGSPNNPNKNTCKKI